MQNAKMKGNISHFGNKLLIKRKFNYIDFKLRVL